MDGEVRILILSTLTHLEVFMFCKRHGGGWGGDTRGDNWLGSSAAKKVQGVWWIIEPISQQCDDCEKEVNAI